MDETCGTVTLSDNTGIDQVYQYVPSTGGWQGTCFFSVMDENGKITHYDPELKEVKMRGLFHVWAVHSKDDFVQDLGVFVADNPDKAKMKALRAGEGLDDLDNIDFVVVNLGPVRAKKEVQEVKIAK